jgi:hypothetical protein
MGNQRPVGLQEGGTRDDPSGDGWKLSRAQIAIARTGEYHNTAAWNATEIACEEVLASSIPRVDDLGKRRRTARKYTR